MAAPAWIYQGATTSKCTEKGLSMQPQSIGGVILIVLGVLALGIRSITYFTTEQVAGPLGFFAWDVSKPHTIFISPLAGLVALAVGVALLMIVRRPTMA